MITCLNPRLFSQYGDYLKAYAQYLHGYEKCLRVLSFHADNEKLQVGMS